MLLLFRRNIGYTNPNYVYVHVPTLSDLALSVKL